MSWDAEKVEKLKELWGKGFTASQIAEKLGGTTRNAVIGKAHRLNLEARAPSKKSSSNQNTNKQQKPHIEKKTQTVSKFHKNKKHTQYQTFAQVNGSSNLSLTANNASK